MRSDIEKIVLRSGKVLGMRTLPSGKVLYVCTVCAKEHENRKAITDHMWVHYKRYNCSICQKPFNRPDRLKNHMQTAHDGQEGPIIKIENVTNISSSKPRKILCKNNFEVIQIKSGRLGIKRLNSGESVYMCLECGKEGSNRKLITKHMWNTHTNNYCQQCSLKFSSPSSLKRHLATAHDQIEDADSQGVLENGLMELDPLMQADFNGDFKFLKI